MQLAAPTKKKLSTTTIGRIRSLQPGEKMSLPFLLRMPLGAGEPQTIPGTLIRTGTGELATEEGYDAWVIIRDSIVSPIGVEGGRSWVHCKLSDLHTLADDVSAVSPRIPVVLSSVPVRGGLLFPVTGTS